MLLWESRALSCVTAALGGGGGGDTWPGPELGCQFISEHARRWTCSRIVKSGIDI